MIEANVSARKGIIRADGPAGVGTANLTCELVRGSGSLLGACAICAPRLTSLRFAPHLRIRPTGNARLPPRAPPKIAARLPITSKISGRSMLRVYRHGLRCWGRRPSHPPVLLSLSNLRSWLRRAHTRRSAHHRDLQVGSPIEA